METAALLIWIKTTGRACKRCLLALVPLNIVTQGMLFSGLVLSPYPYWDTLVVLEGIVLIVEALGYWLANRTAARTLPLSSAFFLSLTLNSASFLIGLLLPF